MDRSPLLLWQPRHQEVSGASMGTRVSVRQGSSYQRHKAQAVVDRAALSDKGAPTKDTKHRLWWTGQLGRGLWESRVPKHSPVYTRRPRAYRLALPHIISLLARLEAGAYQTDQSYSDSSASLVSPNSVLLAKRDRKSQLSDDFRQSEARFHSFLASSDPNCGIYSSSGEDGILRP